ncbi:MAG: O-antigen ligase family protein [Acidobacteria bacterium]|nr:O-antigen ligase family protein [Acidobacteriota bacterium]MBI3422763.1 O-antigen ligase family protein [Acidobacteriota bacterium]
MAGAFFKPKKTATLFQDAPPPSGLTWRANESDFGGALVREKLLHFDLKQNSYRLAFVFAWLFTLVLYVRPQELFPHLFAAYPIQLPMLFATAAPVAFFAARALGGERLFLWTKELQMAFVILALAILFYPLSIDKAVTWKEWNENYLRVFLIFGILIGTLYSRARIYWMMRVTVLSGAWIAFDSIQRYRAGEFNDPKMINRMVASVGGMFGNPNDLATTFGMLLPLAVVLLIVSRSYAKLLYALCIVLFLGATIVTFSRGGFLALAAVVGVLLWKFRKRHRAIPWVAGAMLGGVLLLATPGGFGDRLWTIIKPDADSTGSAQERRDNLKRGVVIFLRHPVFGIGMGTFYVMGIRGRRAHNSYLEIATDLGVLGLLAYLVLIFKPLKALWKIEAETVGARDPQDFENYLLSVALQAALVAYYVNSFFASIQYMWFVYFPIAYAVGLRRIYEREQAIRTQIDAPAHLADFHVGEEDKGTLWKARPLGRLFQPTVRQPDSATTNQQDGETEQAASVPAPRLAVSPVAVQPPTPATHRQLPPPSTNG